MIKDFNTLNDFFNAVNKDVEVNDFVRTYGYSTVNDGGCGLYKVKSILDSDSDDIVFSGLDVTCVGYTLELIPENGTVRVEQFGAVGNCDLENMTATEKTAFYVKNKNAVQAAIDSGASRVEFSVGTYYVAEDILIDHPVDIVGNGATLALETDSTSTQLFRIEYEPEDNTPDKASTIKDLKIVGAYGSLYSAPISSIRINCAYNVTISNVYFDGGDYAVYAKKRALEGYNISGIKIVDCIAENMNKGFAFYTATDVKIRNCRIKLVNGGVGFAVSDDSHTFNVEDLTISGGEVGVDICNVNRNIITATERIFVKNMQVTDTFTAINISDANIPVHFANAMIVGVNVGVCMTRAQNITMTNSSVLSVEPSIADEYTVPVWVVDYAEAKFTHTQFEFPLGFQRIDFETDESVASDLAFVDCTLQKTDIAGVDGVTLPSGFGVFGVVDANNVGVIETFDACEFRSYIDTYVYKVIRNGKEVIVGYTFPVQLSAPNNSGSKLIIKNCRFINEDNSDETENKEYIPYFSLDDNAKFDNIVVYNCFFENYNCSYEVENEDETEDVYPLFGRFVNGSLAIKKEDVNPGNIYNIFAKCNMRSSKPVRNNGTTINEMVTYE